MPSNILGGSRTCRFNKALVETELAISAAASAAYPGDKCAAVMDADCLQACTVQRCQAWHGAYTPLQGLL